MTNTNKSGLIKSPGWSVSVCRHLEHNPPSMMVIPQGHVYRHVCPGCKTEVILHPTEVYLGECSATYT